MNYQLQGINVAIRAIEFIFVYIAFGIFHPVRKIQLGVAQQV